MIEYIVNLDPVVRNTVCTIAAVISIIMLIIAGNIVKELEEVNRKQEAVIILVSGPIGWVIAAIVIPISLVYSTANWIVRELR